MSNPFERTPRPVKNLKKLKNGYATAGSENDDRDDSDERGAYPTGREYLQQMNHTSTYQYAQGNDLHLEEIPLTSLTSDMIKQHSKVKSTSSSPSKCQKTVLECLKCLKEEQSKSACFQGFKSLYFWIQAIVGVCNALSETSIQSCLHQFSFLNGVCNYALDYGYPYCLCNPWYLLARFVLSMTHYKGHLYTVYDAPHWSSYMAMPVFAFQILFLLEAVLSRLGTSCYEKVCECIQAILKTFSFDLWKLILFVTTKVIYFFGLLMERLTEVPGNSVPF